MLKMDAFRQSCSGLRIPGWSNSQAVMSKGIVVAKESRCLRRFAFRHRWNSQHWGWLPSRHDETRGRWRLWLGHPDSFSFQQVSWKHFLNWFQRVFGTLLELVDSRRNLHHACPAVFNQQPRNLFPLVVGVSCKVWTDIFRAAAPMPVGTWTWPCRRPLGEMFGSFCLRRKQLEAFAKSYQLRVGATAT